jgi:Arc/MetJ-type ribon-helix-helix transcriptional regulator
LPEDLEMTLLEAVQNGRFASLDDAVAEAVRQLLHGPSAAPGLSESEDVARLQRENLKRLCALLDALPAAPSPDGLTNRDHDRILYGRP